VLLQPAWLWGGPSAAPRWLSRVWNRCANRFGAAAVGYHRLAARLKTRGQSDARTIPMSLEIGQSCERVFRVDDAAIEAFGAASGDRNPIHFDEAAGAASRFGGRVAHGMLTAAFISALIGNDLPGPGAIYLSQQLSFRAPVRPGDDVRCRVEVTAWDAQRGRATLATQAWVGDTLVVDGEARVIAPGQARAPARPT
jgi:3-hydroxybutyryl-CoA dehydratase